jgi:hypothetical protein
LIITQKLGMFATLGEVLHGHCCPRTFESLRVIAKQGGRSSPICLKILTISLFSLAGMLGKSLTFSVSVSTPSPQHVIWSFDMQSHGGIKPAAVQWSFRYDPGVVKTVEVSASGEAALAGKVITCSNKPGFSTCVLWGRNRNELADGSIAVAKCSLTERARSAVKDQLYGVLAASADGESLTVESSADLPPRAQVWWPARLNDGRLLLLFWRHRKSLAFAMAPLVLGGAAALWLAFGLGKGSRSARTRRRI